MHYLIFAGKSELIILIIMEEQINKEAVLHMRLSDLAAQYRSSKEDSPEHFNALEEYYKAFQELITISGKMAALDPDAELPDRLMPKEYVDYWLSGNN